VTEPVADGAEGVETLDIDGLAIKVRILLS